MIYTVQFIVHVDELCGQERVLIEPIINKVPVNNKGVGEGMLVGAGEDEELVSVLGRVGLMRKELKSLLELALLAERLNQPVVLSARNGWSGGGRAERDG